MTEKDIVRFWSKVNKNGPVQPHCPELGPCWVWKASKGSKGYGQFYYGGQKNGVRIGSHRASYEIANGKIPDGLCALHKCDFRPCVNPAHLFLGTHLDNQQDKCRKGRQAKGVNQGMHTHPENRRFGDENPSRKFPEKLARGVNNNMAKLNDEKVREIRRVYARGNSTLKTIAKDFGVHFSIISDVVNFKTWRHVA